MKIFRHPKGEHEKWAKDARNKAQAVANIGHKTHIFIDVLW
jgi:hypothetical protein